ncbi:hypothetical protein [Billgrantia lactosivorans]|uniref:hypothetical protein n=1 Tax=Billgrantia lactosivorans TaxID=2185141 RepID=UPI000DAD0160|nr:hypothetical protein [Halomonas lactosivorans]
MIKIPDAIRSASGLALLLLLPLTASADTLSVPGDAVVAFQVIDDLTLEAGSERRDDILLRPVSGQDGTTHELPEYCVVVGDARHDGERLRITAKALTCVETEGGNSDIYNGEVSAAAYETDGSYGLAVCDAGRCELPSDHVFHLQLASELEIEEEENPSEQINEQRRQAEGAGVANPIPAERPDPDSD